MMLWNLNGCHPNQEIISITHFKWLWVTKVLQIVKVVLSYDEYHCNIDIIAGCYEKWYY